MYSRAARTTTTRLDDAGPVTSQLYTFVHVQATPPPVFRHALAELGRLLIYEASCLKRLSSSHRFSLLSTPTKETVPCDDPRQS